MLHRVFPLRSLSAALVLSTSLTAPVLAVDENLIGALTGPIQVDAPIDTLTNYATITASTGTGALTLGGSYPASFKKVVNTGEIVATGATTDGISAPVAIESFLNSGSIVSDHFGIYYGGLFLDGVFTNEQGGLIEGDHNGVVIYYGVNTFVNAGTLRSADGSAFRTTFGYVQSFTNTATGEIYGGESAVAFNNGVGTFDNYGLIESTANYAGVYATSATTFTNHDGGIIRSTTGTAIEFESPDPSNPTNVGTFTNNGTIRGGSGVSAYGAAFVDVNVGSFTNGATGKIYGNGGDAVLFDANVTAFNNSGWIEATDHDGVAVTGTAGTFTNQTGATIKSGTGKAVDFDGAVTTFVNNGTVESGYKGIDLDSPTGTFVNTGTIKGGTGYAIDAQSNAFDSFSNSGLIESTGYAAMQIGAVGAFFNSGRITGANYGVLIDGSVASFINSGTISASGSGADAVRIGQALTGTFTNTGTIDASDGFGVSIRAGRLVNTGTIRGVTGINSDLLLTATTIVNSGTIEGTGGTAFYLGDETVDDTVEVLTGSLILGTMDFSHGNDTLDISGFRGSTVMTVARLETVVSGNALVNDQRDGAGSGTISVVDATAIRSGGATVMGEVAGAIGGEIAGALGGITGGAGPVEPMGYAPSRPVGAAEAAADELIATAEPTGPEVWGKVFGGIANKSTDYSAVLGGIIAGSHVAVDADTRLGGVVSVSGSRFVTAGGGQEIGSTIGSTGLYGSTDLGEVTLSYSLLAGVAANHSDRTVTAMVTETARADFASWYWSPELGLSIPVPLLEGVDTAAGFKLRYIGGGTGSYTETGSSQNLSVGTSAVNLLDARVELTGTAQVAANDFGEVMLSAAGGLLAQHNFGSSVAVAGFPLATTPAAFAYGAYGDLTLDAPIGPASSISASAGLELRSDGASSASTNLGLSATF